MHRASCVIALACSLAACGSPDKSSDDAVTPLPNAATIHVSKSNVFSPLVQDLNKAKAVNGQVQAQGQQTDQAIESQSSAPAAATSNDP